MAETDGRLTETTTPSIPIHLSGFLSGDNIQVHGETHNLQFSLQFNIHHKYNSDSQFHFPPTFSLENHTPLTSSNSSYATPTTTQEVENQDATENPLHETIGWTPTTPQDCNATNGNPLCDTIDWIPTTPRDSNVTNKDVAIVTRLRSGVLSPVTYYPRIAKKVHRNLPPSKRGLKKTGMGEMDLLARVLKRHSLPIRPCNSYSFFAMASWGVVKSSSFGDTSKRLGEMWGKLPHSEKKVFEDMALKDHARYKKQCMMLTSKKKRIEVLGKCFRG